MLWVHHGTPPSHRTAAGRPAALRTLGSSTPTVRCMGVGLTASSCGLMACARLVSQPTSSCSASTWPSACSTATFGAAASCARPPGRPALQAASCSTCSGSSRLASISGSAGVWRGAAAAHGGQQQAGRCLLGAAHCARRLVQWHCCAAVCVVAGTRTRAPRTVFDARVVDKLGVHAVLPQQRPQLLHDLRCVAVRQGGGSGGLMCGLCCATACLAWQHTALCVCMPRTCMWVMLMTASLSRNAIQCAPCRCISINRLSMDLMRSPTRACTCATTPPPPPQHSRTCQINGINVLDNHPSRTGAYPPCVGLVPWAQNRGTAGPQGWPALLSAALLLLPLLLLPWRS
jgi:hypothetical protein